MKQVTHNADVPCSMLLMVIAMPAASHGQMIWIICIKTVAHVYNHVLRACSGYVRHSVSSQEHANVKLTRNQFFCCAFSVLLSVAKRAIGPMQPVALHDSFVTNLTLSQNNAEAPGNFRGHPTFVLEWELTGHRPAALGLELRDIAPLASEK